ncbi:MAG: N-acetylmuramoyl-L-alanine amidase [uncultured bacterium]|nr:MAG: N-acetylmuramoyl-L-alanine amidase [uncultured bacterium]
MLLNIRRNKTAFLVMVTAILILTGLGSYAQDGYISARSFAESQGIAYQWFPLQKILVMRKGLKTVRLTVDDTRAIVDGSEVSMAAPPRIQQGQIMVPAASLTRFFQASDNADTLQITPPRIQIQQPSPPQVTMSQPPVSQPIAVTPAPAVPPQPVTINTPPVAVSQPVAITPAAPDNSGEAVLVALRHSVREDHTRVVLEFSNDITYRTNFKDGLYRLTVSGCRNLVPTQRTNPAGRDIAKFDINSGPDRKGLILSFHLSQKDKQPTIETVSGPFRMIISFASPETPLASAPATLVASSPVVITANATQTVKAPEPAKMESAPEINIEVTEVGLSKPEFAGRTIIVDAGHGGNDRGYTFEGRPDEKQINLAIAQHLKTSLEKTGFKVMMTRSSDIDITHAQRLSIANRHGADLYISLHLGGSSDTTKAGVACYSYGKKGTAVDEAAQGLNYEAVYSEWLKNTRFDLSKFLARKITERMVQHLKVENRGAKDLPLQPLQFIMIPAVVVETGMLSDPTEGKNLISDNYRKAIAQSISNAVVDFFNGIVINQ